MKDNEIIKLLIEYCEERIKETPKLKSLHYKKLKRKLEKTLK